MAERDETRRRTIGLYQSTIDFFSLISNTIKTQSLLSLQSPGWHVNSPKFRRTMIHECHAISIIVPVLAENNGQERERDRITQGMIIYARVCRNIPSEMHEGDRVLDFPSFYRRAFIM